MNSLYSIFIIGILFASIKNIFNFSIINTLIICGIMLGLYLWRKN